MLPIKLEYTVKNVLQKDLTEASVEKSGEWWIHFTEQVCAKRFAPQFERPVGNGCI